MYFSFSLHDQDTHLAELWYEGFIKNLFANCRSRVGPSTLLNTIEGEVRQRRILQQTHSTDITKN